MCKDRNQKQVNLLLGRNIQKILTGSREEEERRKGGGGVCVLVGGGQGCGGYLSMHLGPQTAGPLQTGSWPRGQPELGPASTPSAEMPLSPEAPRVAVVGVGWGACSVCPRMGVGCPRPRQRMRLHSGQG